ncbi:hypothetical protein PG990_008134 [Apiospora arundinis]
MDNCWFVLKQPIHGPPQYKRPNRARGEADGSLRLGDIVPAPTEIYPIITQPDDLLPFPFAMKIRTAPCEGLAWESSSGNSIAGAAGAGAPIAAAAGVMINGQVGAGFRDTVTNWAKFEHMDVEVIQPSTGYVDDVLATEPLQQWIKHHKNPFTGSWTVYMIIGLMISRGKGSVGRSDATSRELSSQAGTDLPGVANANIDASFSKDRGNTLSMELTTDRIWAIRLAKIHKGALRSRWQQTEEREGAALDGEADVENIEQALRSEGLDDIITAAANNGSERLIFVLSEKDEYKPYM